MNVDELVVVQHYGPNVVEHSDLLKTRLKYCV
jgi:hypothetical protein